MLVSLSTIALRSSIDISPPSITVSVIRPEQADSDIINLEVGGDMSIELLKAIVMSPSVMPAWSRVWEGFWRSWLL
jgi:hypothetical protein